MRKLTLALFGMVAVTATGMGCSSSDSGGGSGTGGAPDFGALEERLTKPSGTFDESQASPVLDGYGQQNESATSGNPFGGSSSSTQSAGLAIQAEGSACNNLGQGGQGSCSCPSGGTLTWDMPQGSSMQSQNSSGAIDQTVSIVASACSDGKQTIDGSIYYKIKSVKQDRSDLFMLYAIHVKLSGTRTGQYDVDYLYKNGVITFAVDVKDGKVLVSAKGNWNKNTKTGTLTITDKNTTWTCEAVNGKGTCKNTAGETRNFG